MLGHMRALVGGGGGEEGEGEGWRLVDEATREEDGASSLAGRQEDLRMLRMLHVCDSVNVGGREMWVTSSDASLLFSPRSHRVYQGSTSG